jgi:hypothetical protein
MRETGPRRGRPGEQADRRRAPGVAAALRSRTLRLLEDHADAEKADP